jgi:glycosyltransferase involved in cell wall biosynthesis
MLLYISFVDFRAFFAQGVYRKIQAQVKSMKKEFDKAYYTGWLYPKAVLFSESGIVETEPAVTKKDYVEAVTKWIQQYKVTRTYIRYAGADKWFVDLLEYQNKHGIKTVLEIASYPYDVEAAEGVVKLESLCFDKEIRSYVSKIATYSSHRKIWGLPCFNLINGIDLKEHPISAKKQEAKKIVLIAVSTMQCWQGYERILTGMHLYNQAGGKYDVQLKFVGDGPEKKYYEELTVIYQLQHHVEFIGRIEVFEKEKLDYQYDLADIAVGTLGFYKALRTQEGSPIKGAEYCARGIPFICGYRDLRFPPDWEFMLNVPNKDEPIDMNSVIAFYEKIVSKKNYKQLMRNYAEKYLTWDKIMEPVVEYLR